MSKRETYEPLARQYFVESQMPVSSIAKRLPVTEKTLHNWKKEGNWEQQRANFLRSKYSCYGSLYELVSLLVQDSLHQFKTDGTFPEAKTLSFLINAAEKLPKMKNFENLLAEEQIENSKEEDTANKSDSINILEQIDKHLKGLS